MNPGSPIRGNMQPDIRDKVMKFGLLFDRIIQAEVERRGIFPAHVKVSQPCNLLCVLDQNLLHFIYDILAGSNVQIFVDERPKVLSSEELTERSEFEHGFLYPNWFHFPALILDLPEANQLPEIENMARLLVNQCITARDKSKTRPRIPGYEGLEPFVNSFFQDHPDFASNVFIAMRFRSGKQFVEMHDAVRSALAKYGLKGLRSDDKTYPHDGDLWNNICVYMMGCKFGVCIFEEIDEREFNPNVPLEYGFMRALNRQVLLLKDIRMPKMPADITGKLYRSFDTYNITLTIHEQISQWAERDLGLKPL